MDLPDPAWHIVAQYLPAQPVLYMRMATVNKQFYKVFMSNQVWARVNVYGVGVERKISTHFIERVSLESPEHLDLMRRVTAGKLSTPQIPEMKQWLNVSANLYARYAAFTAPRAQMLVLEMRLVGMGPNFAHRVIAESGRIEYLHDNDYNRELALAAVSYNGLNLVLLPGFMKTDRDVVFAAVRNNGLALQYADTRFLDDHEILLAAVFQNGLALQFVARATEFGTIYSGASDRIILTALKSNSHAASYLGDGVFAHVDCFTAASESGNALFRVNNPVYDPSRAWVFAKNNPQMR